jgi:hypothetical protein
MQKVDLVKEVAVFYYSQLLNLRFCFDVLVVENKDIDEVIWISCFLYLVLSV